MFSYVPCLPAGESSRIVWAIILNKLPIISILPFFPCKYESNIS